MLLKDLKPNMHFKWTVSNNYHCIYKNYHCIYKLIRFEMGLVRLEVVQECPFYPKDRYKGQIVNLEIDRYGQREVVIYGSSNYRRKHYGFCTAKRTG